MKMIVYVAVLCALPFILYEGSRYLVSAGVPGTVVAPAALFISAMFSWSMARYVVYRKLW